MKKYDIVATVGTYQKNGETKSRFKNVGVVMEKDGRPYILIDRTFNIAGLPNPDGRDNALLSLFEPRDNADSKPAPSAELDDSIGF